MVKTMDEFADGPRRDVGRWKADLSPLEAVGPSAQVAKIRSWIEAGEQILVLHERRYA